MGLFDWLFNKLYSGGKCKKLISYDTRILKFEGLGVNVQGVSITLGKFETHKTVLRQAADLAEMLDNLQYHLCSKLSNSFWTNQMSPQQRETYVNAMIFSEFMMVQMGTALVSFKQDPDEQSANLEISLKRISEWIASIQDDVASGKEIGKMDSPILKAYEALKIDPKEISDKLDEITHGQAKLTYEIKAIKNKIKGEPSSNEQISFKLNLMRHLEFCKSLTSEASPIDGKTLQEMYVKNILIRTKIDTWDKSDRELTYNLQDTWKIESFLGEERWLAVVGAPFGIGKTSLALTTTVCLASSFILNSENAANYVPIYVPLKDRLKDIDDRGNSLEHLLSLLGKIQCNDGKILLICDGLDEFPESQIEKLLDKLEQFRIELSNLKVLITTRLNSGLPTKLPFLRGEYIRLLSFTKEQVNSFFLNYGLSINYDVLRDHGLDEEEILKPLYAWMFAITYSDFDIEVDFKEIDNMNVKRSIIYHQFIYSLIRGKLKFMIKNPDLENTYSLEKQIIRKIAYLKQVLDEDLTLKTVKEYVQQHVTDYKDESLEIVQPVLTSYFYLRTTSDLGMRVDFMHRSFKEYLLAEYYIESLLEDNTLEWNEFVPSFETTLFLDGLLEILNNSKYEKIAKRIMKSMSKKAKATIGDDQNTINALQDAAFNVFERKTINLDKLGKSEDRLVSQLEYQNMWLHRWLSLFILNKLSTKYKIPPEKFKELVRMTSNIVPTYLQQINNIDLSSIELDSNIPDYNFSNGNLMKSKLHGTFIGTNFSGANLSNSYIEVGTSFIHCNFSGANLSNLVVDDTTKYSTRFIDCDLTMCNLTNANIGITDFRGSNFEEANLCGASLVGSLFSGSNLSKVAINDQTDTQAIELFGKDDGVGYNREWEDLKYIKELIDYLLFTLDVKLKDKIIHDNPDLLQVPSDQ